jgi:arylsulfatase
MAPIEFGRQSRKSLSSVTSAGAKGRRLLSNGLGLVAGVPSFTSVPTPAPGSPNVVMIVLDDLGFARLGCFGSDLDTPSIDSLAAGGLRYRRFHVTAMCSPTRACVLTGRNQHRVGMGFLADLPVGFPGYNGRIRRSAAMLPRLLRDAGYSTFALGMWHLVPRFEQSAAGPFERWPLGVGFERYYGFLNGDTNQWTPDLVRDNGFVEPPPPPARRLPPHRGSRRSGDQDDPGSAGGGSGQAVLLLPRHRCGPCPASRAP